jgi:hypothetical protein
MLLAHSAARLRPVFLPPSASVDVKDRQGPGHALKALGVRKSSTA